MLFPEAIELQSFMIKRLYPIPFASGYWYFNAYTVVFFMIPFMNRFLMQLPKTTFLVVAKDKINGDFTLPQFPHIQSLGMWFHWS